MNSSIRRIALLPLVLLVFEDMLLGANTYNGKIYTVVACVSIIIIGVIFFLFYLDRRMKKLEDSEN